MVGKYVNVFCFVLCVFVCGTIVLGRDKKMATDIILSEQFEEL